MGDRELARATHAQAMAAREKVLGPAHLSVADSASRLAVLLTLAGQDDKARGLEQRALALRASQLGPTHRLTGVSLYRLANIEREIGDLGKAEVRVREAIDLLAANGDIARPDLGKAMSVLALVLSAKGEFGPAESWARRAIDVLQAASGVDPVDLVTAQVDLAGVFYVTGALEPSQALMEKVLNKRESMLGADNPSTVSSMINLAVLSNQLKHYDKAESLYLRALPLLEQRMGPDDRSVLRARNNLASLYLNQERYLEARVLFESVFSAYAKANGPTHLTTNVSRVNLGGVYKHLGEYAKALPLAQESLAYAEAVGDAEVTWSSLIHLMDLHGSDPRNPSFDLSLATWYGKRAINAIQRSRGSVEGVNQQRGLTFAKQYEKAYRALAAQLVHQQRLSEAEEVLELLKEQELSDVVRAGPASILLSESAVERRASQEQVNLVKGAAAELAELVAFDRRDLATLTAAERTRRQYLMQRAQQLRDDYQRFLQRVAAVFKESASLVKDGIEVRTGGLQEGVARDAAGAVGLHYLVGERQLSIIVATTRGMLGRTSDISQADLSKLVINLRTAIRSKADTRPHARALWQVLIEPVWQDLKDADAKTLVLSLTGTLRYLPFATLQDAAGRYLVQDFAAVQWAGAAKIQPGRTSDTWRVAGMGLTQGRPGFSALPAVKGELAAIVRTAQNPQGVLPGSIAIDEDFTKDRFELALGGRENVLHVASHFKFSTGSESLSVLLMGKDGETLSLRDMSVMDFGKVDLLTLSACETAMGGGQDDTGAEVEGLAATVLKAKAQSVLATLWAVPDTSTAEVMKQFYRHRASNAQLSRAQALRAAQLKLLAADNDRSLDPKWAHPYYWAPFILAGNWL
jgi:CHAT domain-containing protein